MLKILDLESEVLSVAHVEHECSFVSQASRLCKEQPSRAVALAETLAPQHARE